MKDITKRPKKWGVRDNAANGDTQTVVLLVYNGFILQRLSSIQTADVMQHRSDNIIIIAISKRHNAVQR